MNASLLIDLTIPGPALDFSIDVDSSSVQDDTLALGQAVTLLTGGFNDVSFESSFNLSSFAFSTGLDVSAEASISDIVIDAVGFDPHTIEGIGVSYADQFELLGFGLTPDDQGDFFSSDIDLIDNYLNDNVPVDDILVGNYAIPSLPVDFNWNLNNLGYEASTQNIVPTSFASPNFQAESSSGLSFANIALDLSLVHI